MAFCYKHQPSGHGVTAHYINRYTKTAYKPGGPKMVDSVCKNITFDPKEPWRALFHQGSPKSALQGPFRGPFRCQWRSKWVPWALAKYNNDHKHIPWCYEGFKNVFLEKVNWALQNLENYMFLFAGPCRAQWRTMDGQGPCRGSFCVRRVPWYEFWCLECKKMANIADFFLWAKHITCLESFLFFRCYKSTPL